MCYSRHLLQFRAWGRGEIRELEARICVSFFYPSPSLPRGQSFGTGGAQAGESLEGAAPGLIGFSLWAFPDDVGFVKEAGVIANEFFQVPHMVDAAIRGGEGPLPSSNVDVGGLEFGVFESGGAPLGFALEMDAAQVGADTFGALHAIDPGGFKGGLVFDPPAIKPFDRSLGCRSDGLGLLREEVRGERQTVEVKGEAESEAWIHSGYGLQC